MKRVHFLGIAGSGASAVAAIAQSQGFKITGCDKNLTDEFTKPFTKNQLFDHHSSDHLKDIDILATTPAIFSLDPNNPELKTAKEKGIEILTWQQFMGQFLEKDKFVIAVCGTHGKSTVTAMIGLMLEEAGLDPTVELGAVVTKWGANYRTGQGKYFVTEADEFNDNFLASHPDITVITTVEMDHPEYFKDFDAYKESFRKFLGQTKRKIIANLRDRGVEEVITVLKGQAFQKKAWPLLEDYSEDVIDFPLEVPGQYNILNASAVFQAGLALDINPEIIRQSLSSYQGIRRRFEFLGESRGAKVYADFGHHPTEIKATIAAACEKFPDKKITLIFQPHMFSRTKALFDDFVKVFRELPIEKIYITDIYPSREIDTGLVNSKQLVEAVDKASVNYLPSPERPGLFPQGQAFSDADVIFFMGAGDIDQLAHRLVSHPRKDSPS